MIKVGEKHQATPGQVALAWLLGLRHAFTKKTIMTSQDLNETTFDIAGYHCIEYGWKTKREKEELEKKIIDVLEKMRTSIDEKFGPVHTYLGRRYEISEFDKGELLNQLDAVAGDIVHICSDSRDLCRSLFRDFPGAVIEPNFSINKEVISDEYLSKYLNTSDIGFFRRRYPAIEYHIAKNKIVPHLNGDGSMSSFNTHLRNIYRLMFSALVTVEELINYMYFFHMLLRDSAKLRTAIDQEKFGKNLNLESLEIVNIAEEINSAQQKI